MLPETAVMPACTSMSVHLNPEVKASDTVLHRLVPPSSGDRRHDQCKNLVSQEHCWKPDAASYRARVSEPPSSLSTSLEGAEKDPLPCILKHLLGHPSGFKQCINTMAPKSMSTGRETVVVAVLAVATVTTASMVYGISQGLDEEVCNNRGLSSELFAPAEP